MSSISRGIVAEQTDCLVCDKVVKELRLGLCIGCYMDLHYTWAICEPEQKEKKYSGQSLMDALYRAHFGMFGSDEDEGIDGEGWKYRKGKKDKGYLDDVEGVGSNG